MRLLALSASGLLLLPALAGCQKPVPYEVISAGVIAPGSEIRMGSESPILSISGAISSTGTGESLSVDLEALEQFGLVRYTLTDPFTLQDVTYTGVLLSTLLDLVGADPAATRVVADALDDYRAVLPIVDLQEWPIMLATRQDGKPIPVAEGGPTRIVYPIHAYPELRSAAIRPRWVWSVKSLEVR